MPKLSKTIMKNNISILLVPILLSGLLMVNLALGDETEVVDDAWYLLKMNGLECGWNHEKTIRFEKEGAEYFKTTVEVQEIIEVDGEPVLSIINDWIIEDHRGCIIEMFSKATGGDRVKTSHLKVKGDIAELIRSENGEEEKKTLAWEDKVLGPYGLMHKLIKSNGFRPGTKKTCRTFRHNQPAVFDLQIHYIGWEEIDLPSGEKKKLFHITLKGLKPEKALHRLFVDSNGKAVYFTLEHDGIRSSGFRTTEKRAKKAFEEIEEIDK